MSNQVISNSTPTPLIFESKSSRCCPSLSKLFAHMTIEPLAFLAIMALYIEFPSIQDLIYTKICLQVVSDNGLNYTQTLVTPPASNTTTNSSLPLFLTPSILNDQNQTINLLKPNFTQLIDNSLVTLSPNGKIQDRNTFLDISNRLLHNISIVPTIQESASSITNKSLQHHVICDRLNKTNTPLDIRKDIATGHSLFWLKYELLICTLCVLSSPYWGGMSDKIGRLIPLNVPIVMAIISNIISLAFGVAITLNWHAMLPVEWLYTGALLTGISGGQAVIMINSFGFISDNTSSESRSKRVVVLESVIYVAHSVGYYMSKHIMSIGLTPFETYPWFNRHLVAFSCCILFNFFAFLYAITKLRHRKFHRFVNNFEREHQETFAGDMLSQTGGTNLSTQVAESETNIVNQDRQRELTASTPDDLDGPIAKADKNWTDFGVILTFRYYKETYETLTKKRESRIIILLLLFCCFISAMSLVSLMSLLYLYLHNDPFNWSTSRYSNWNSLASLSRGVALIGLTMSKLFKVWEMPDPIVAALGFLSKGIGLLLIGMAQTSDIVDWSLIAFIPSEYSMPPIRSLLSKLVVREEVGKLYSCLGAIQSICLLVGNVVFYLAYSSLEMHEFFRLSFLVVACFQFAAVLIMLIIYTISRHKILII